MSPLSILITVAAAPIARPLPNPLMCKQRRDLVRVLRAVLSALLGQPSKLGSLWQGSVIHGR
jgi:hypothetical protein